MVKMVWLFRYPDGVPIEEGEKWYLGVHSQEVKKFPGLKKYLTWKILDVKELPWYEEEYARKEPGFIRFTELWWDDVESWLKLREERAKLTPPWWGEPWLIAKPVFINEEPEYDFLTQIPKI